MGFRVHRSAQILPGVRLNFSKSGVGYSIGPKGFRTTHMANGRTRRTVSIPGTGMSWVTESSSGRPRSAPAPRQTAPPEASASQTDAKPGWFAPAEEKELFKAVHDHDVGAVRGIAGGGSPVADAAATVAALMLLQADEDDAALGLLQRLSDTGFDPATDPFLTRYVSMGATVEIVAGASTHLALDRSMIGLLLAELLQRKGELTAAIAAVEQLEQSTPATLSLAELDCEAGRYDEVITITEGAPNVDDATSLLWVFRGVAFREQGHHDAAMECFAKVIRCRSRDPIVLHRARLERARCYAAQGKITQARKELATIQAEDSTFEGLDDALAQLDTPKQAGPAAQTP